MKLKSIFLSHGYFYINFARCWLFQSTKIETVNGETILTTDKPQEDEATGLITYKDAEKLGSSNKLIEIK